MKMFKKIMAVALVGVMALSMLTGCAVKNENDMKSALKLAGQTRGVTVEVNNDKKVDGRSCPPGLRKPLACSMIRLAKI